MRIALVRLSAGIALSVFTSFIMAPVAIANSDESMLSFRNLMDVHREDLTSFWNQQEEDSSFVRHNARALQDDSQQEFGQRCGNNNPCLQGMNCVHVNNLSLGNRCLPASSCLEDTYYARADSGQGLDLNSLKERMFQAAGYSQDEIFAALENAGNERAFLETDEFQALRRSLHENMGPLTTAFEEMSNTCVDNAEPNQDVNVTGSVTYVGLHIEVRNNIT
jgi:hypothetical protein